MVDRESITKTAQSRADQILAQARADAQATRHDADDYVIDSLQTLEGELTRLMSQVRNGIRSLEEERLRSAQNNYSPPGSRNNEPLQEEVED
jgi:hypothetical protein